MGGWLDLHPRVQPAFHSMSGLNGSIALGEGHLSSASVRPQTALTSTTTTTTTTTTTPRGARAV